MANYFKNVTGKGRGIWGPITYTDANGDTPESFSGREVTVSFDDSTTSATLYTKLFEVPVSAETELVWNPDAVTLETTCDVTLYWQGTDDPAVAHDASDTGWTSVAVHTMTSDDTSSAKTQATLASVSNVVQKPYMRVKLVHAVGAGAATATDEVKLRLTNLPPVGGGHMSPGMAL